MVWPRERRALPGQAGSGRQVPASLTCAQGPMQRRDPTGSRSLALSSNLKQPFVRKGFVRLQRLAYGTDRHTAPCKGASAFTKDTQIRQTQTSTTFELSVALTSALLLAGYNTSAMAQHVPQHNKLCSLTEQLPSETQPRRHCSTSLSANLTLVTAPSLNLTQLISTASLQPAWSTCSYQRAGLTKCQTGPCHWQMLLALTIPTTPPASLYR